MKKIGFVFPIFFMFCYNIDAYLYFICMFVFFRGKDELNNHDLSWCQVRALIPL